MGVSVIGSGGVDKSLCLPFGTLANGGSTIAATTSYQTVYSGTGSGYLDYALATQSGASIIPFLRVTIDGTIVFEGQAAVSSNVTLGLLNRNYLDGIYNGSSVQNYLRQLYPFMYSGISLSAPTAYPYTANAAGGNNHCPSNDSFYFKNSILVEIKASSAQTIPYYLAGGKTP